MTVVLNHDINDYDVDNDDDDDDNDGDIDDNDGDKIKRSWVQQQQQSGIRFLLLCKARNLKRKICQQIRDIATKEQPFWWLRNQLPYLRSNTMDSNLETFFEISKCREIENLGKFLDFDLFQFCTCISL